MTCYRCGEQGHYANKCPNPPKDDKEREARCERRRKVGKSQTSTKSSPADGGKRSVESEPSLIPKGTITSGGQKYPATVLLDGAAEINVINQGFAVASDLRPIESELPAPQFMDGKEVY